MLQNCDNEIMRKSENKRDKMRKKEYLILKIYIQRDIKIAKKYKII